MEQITVETVIAAPIEKVWGFFNEPEHVIKWNHASDDWHSPRAENDLRVGGTFNYRMEAKDGSVGFDFTGTYEEVVPNKLIRYVMDDGRKVGVSFEDIGGSTEVRTIFDPETENPIEMQRGGWQSILDNFKKYTEAN